jgi:CRP-like cAMP-binding protein
LPRIQQVIDTLEAECAELRERLAWLEVQLKEFQAHQETAAGDVPVRSRRRATARRASRRRAAARARKLDTKTSIVEFLAEHPGSTAGEVAKGLDLNRGSVSTRLTQLAKLGEIRKAERGYAAK